MIFFAQTAKKCSSQLKCPVLINVLLVLIVMETRRGTVIAMEYDDTTTNIIVIDLRNKNSIVNATLYFS